MDNETIRTLLLLGNTPADIGQDHNGYNRDLFNRAVAIDRELNGPVKCWGHDRVWNGKDKWTCVGCGDTVDSLPAGERPYDTSGDF